MRETSRNLVGLRTAYQLQHPSFPATSSSLEMYDEFDFEAFNELGHHLGLAADLDGQVMHPRPWQNPR